MRRFFPQDEIWKAASSVDLKLLKVNGRWCTEFKISGIIGRDPFEGLIDDDDDDGGLLEQEEIDQAELIGSILADLTKARANG